MSHRSALEFSGSPQHREMLHKCGSRFRARWDRVQKAYCLHQKSWIIDTGWDTETTSMSRHGRSVLEHSSGAHSSHHSQNHFTEDNLYVRPR